MHLKELRPVFFQHQKGRRARSEHLDGYPEPPVCSTYIVVHAVPERDGAVRTLSELLTERSQRFDSSAHTEN